MQYHGQLYRALNPVYARTPLSGQGAALYGGRFNPKGMLALYTSLSIMTALKEANQVGRLQPTTLVSYQATIESVFDGRDGRALADQGFSLADLPSASWRDQAKAEGEAPTQTLARRLVKAGYHGLMVPSFAAGATAADLNLVLWQWSDHPPTQLELIDDEGRLLRPQT
jgi:RES domain-containing protein